MTQLRGWTPRTDLPFDRDDLTLDYSLRQYAWAVSDPERFVQRWHVQVEARPGPDVDAKAIEVATADLVRLDLDRVVDAGASPYGLLDAESADLATIAGHVFDPASDQLQEDLVDALSPSPHPGILILDQVWVAPAYRGHEIGPLVAACALEALGTGCALALGFPSPFENPPDDGPELAEAIAHLGRVWAKVGFEPYGDTGVHFLDLSTTVLSDALERLSRTRQAV